jgi:conjugal transfer pilus assembly protein TraF
MIWLISLLLSWSLITSSQAAPLSSDFYKHHAEGWFWYHDPPLMEEKEEGPQSPLLKTEKPKSVEEQASETLALYKKQLEQKLHLALVSPTSQNVQNYMQFQKDMMERSERFSKIWQQVVLTHPDLNHETKFPTAQYARHIYDDQIRHKKEQTIQLLAKTFGLFYFFSGSCAYCREFAPIVKLFADKYQWQVIAISLDGSTLELFENTQTDNGIASALDIQTVPTLMAYNASTQEVIPLAYAPVSLDQLEDNVMALIGEGG